MVKQRQNNCLAFLLLLLFVSGQSLLWLHAHNEEPVLTCKHAYGINHAHNTLIEKCLLCESAAYSMQPAKTFLPFVLCVTGLLVFGSYAFKNYCTYQLYKPSRGPPTLAYDQSYLFKSKNQFIKHFNYDIYHQQAFTTRAARHAAVWRL